MKASDSCKIQVIASSRAHKAAPLRANNCCAYYNAIYYKIQPIIFYRCLALNPDGYTSLEKGGRQNPLGLPTRPFKSIHLDRFFLLIIGMLKKDKINRLYQKEHPDSERPGK